MTHWILLILAVLSSAMITRYQYFYLDRITTFSEGFLVGMVFYIIFVLIFNKYSAKDITDDNKITDGLDQ